MIIKTSRFGNLEVAENEIINFNEGFLGFENLQKYFIVDPGDNTLILWLQAVDDEKIAFPIIEPKIFSPEYVVKLTNYELTALNLENVNTAKIYTILTIPQNVTEMSANMKAPIVINNNKKIAKQIILQDSKLSVKHEMYKELKKYIVSYSSDDSKRTNVELSKNNNIQAENLGNQDTEKIKQANIRQ